MPPLRRRLGGSRSEPDASRSAFGGLLELALELAILEQRLRGGLAVASCARTRCAQRRTR